MIWEKKVRTQGAHLSLRSRDRAGGGETPWHCAERLCGKTWSGHALSALHKVGPFPPASPLPGAPSTLICVTFSFGPVPLTSLFKFSLDIKILCRSEAYIM